MRWSLCLPVIIFPVAAGADGSAPLFGLVIGWNGAPRAEVAPLRYADDDAVQNAILLGELGARVVMLAGLDAETQALAPDLHPAEPTRDSLTKALEKLNVEMKAARVWA